MYKVLIVGATSAIAEATARIYAQRGSSLYLLARNQGRLAAVADDLRVRGAAEVTTGRFDAKDHKKCKASLAAVWKQLGEVDLVLIAHGSLPDQRACERDASVTLDELHINAISTIVLLTSIANSMEAQGSGSIAVISSVAGDRGRQSNYVYGAAKRMVSTFVQGLRNRLHKRGVRVLDIKPGFVDTPMTAAYPKGLLWASPDKVAQGIAGAVDARRNVVYLPWFWRYIMYIIRNIPESVFVRLKL